MKFSYNLIATLNINKTGETTELFVNLLSFDEITVCENNGFAVG